MRSSRYILALLIAALWWSGMSRQVGWAPLANGSVLGQQQDQPASSAGRIIRQGGGITPAAAGSGVAASAPLTLAENGRG